MWKLKDVDVDVERGGCVYVCGCVRMWMTSMWGSQKN